MLTDLFTLALQFRYFHNLGKSIVDYFNQVRGLFGSLRIVDVVDIVFVAVVLYIIIRIIRETRAMQLIKGLFLFAILYFIVSFLGMSASSYFLKQIFSNVILIIVVLFGPEIRSILEQLGKGAARVGFMQFLKSGNSIELSEQTKAIDAICKACSDMSDSKTGALIVCERETMLGDIIQSGTRLDALASRELIGNVFFPKSPLHDGAMIVRKGIISAAGCILPISRDNDISSELGTRHRAAIGLSQQCDAVIVVVSEETGYISVATGGTLMREISSGELRDILTKALLPSDSSMDKTKIKKLVRRIKK